jgi:periplasmic protein TonB
MLVYSPSPNYSEDARKAKLQGTVILSLVVDVHGNPIDIRVVRSLGMGLDENAVEAARTWKFTPGTRNVVPVPVRMLLVVQFRLF